MAEASPGGVAAAEDLVAVGARDDAAVLQGRRAEKSVPVQSLAACAMAHVHTPRLRASAGPVARPLATRARPLLAVLAALAPVLLAGAASTISDYGLRGLATTWETDDDNSILQLVGLPRAASGAKVKVVGPFLWYSAPGNSHLELLPCAMAFDAGNATVARAPAFFFASGDALGPVSIYTVDAVQGALVRNTSVVYGDGPLAVTALAYNAASGLLDALVYLGTAPAAAAIDPVTGVVTLLAVQFELPDFQGPCEAAVAPHVRTGSRLYFVQQDAYGWQRANESFLMSLELATGNVMRLVPWSPHNGMLSNVAALDAAVPGGSELVLFTTSAWDQDLNTTAELTLWSLDPSAGAASAAVVAVVKNPDATGGPLLPTWGTLAVDGVGAARTVSMLVTNNNGRIFTRIVELNVTVALTGVVAAGAPQLTEIDVSDVTGGMIYRLNRVVY